MTREEFPGVEARGPDRSPGRAGHHRARGIGRPVAPVGAGREHRDARMAIEYARGGECQLLSTPSRTRPRLEPDRGFSPGNEALLPRPPRKPPSRECRPG